MAERELN